MNVEEEKKKKKRKLGVVGNNIWYQRQFAVLSGDQWLVEALMLSACLEPASLKSRTSVESFALLTVSTILKLYIYFIQCGPVVAWFALSLESIPVIETKFLFIYLLLCYYYHYYYTITTTTTTIIIISSSSCISISSSSSSCISISSSSSISSSNGSSSSSSSSSSSRCMYGRVCAGAGVLYLFK